MLPTLQILCEAAYSATTNEPVKEQLDRFLVFEEQIRDQLGLKFVTEMENAWDDLHQAELDRAFEVGFLTAWKLWVEVYSLKGATTGM